MNNMLQKTAPFLLLAYTFLLCFFITQLPLPYTKFREMNFDIFPRMVAGISVLGVLGLYYTNLNTSRFFSKEWAVLNLYILFSFSAVYILFRESTFGLNGLTGDACFNAAMVTKYKYFNSLTDFNYHKLTTSYPALYHFVLGKYAAMFKVESYTAVWHGYILTYCVMAVPLYLLFKKAVGSLPAVAIIIVMFLGFPIDNLYKPYEFITAMAFLAWWVVYIEGKVPDKKTLTIAGVIGGLIFMTYYYWFFIAALYLLIKLTVELSENLSIKKVFVKRKDTITILFIAALVSAVYWLPLGIQFYKYGVESLQNMWLSPEMNEFVFLKEESAFLQLLLGIGVIMVFVYKEDKIMQVCRWLLASLACWYTLGYLLLYIGKPIVANKIHFLAYAICALALFHWLFNLAKIKEIYRNGVVAVTLAVLLVIGSDIFLGLKKHSFFSTTLAYKTQALQKNEEQVNIFKNKVMLTDRQHINALIPTHVFVNINAHFSHPASQFRQRISFLKDMQQIQNPQVLAWFLTYNKFDKIDLLYFINTPSLFIYDDNFPRGHKEIRIDLTSTLYNSSILKYATRLPGEQGTVYELIAPPFDLKNTFSQVEMELAKKYALIGL